MTDQVPQESGGAAKRWQKRPWPARGVRALTALLPVAGAAGAAVAAARFAPAPDGLLQQAGWWGAVVAASGAGLFAIRTLLRPLGPLASLLGMTLEFPGEAPSRLQVARRSRRSVEDHLAGLGNLDPGDLDGALGELLTSAVRQHGRFGDRGRVAAYAELMGRELGLDEASLGKLGWAATLHDIGKLRISEGILGKAGSLTDAEWAKIEQHPQHGLELCGPLREWLGDWAGAIGEHHERFDGTGYPDGKTGEEISLAGRICAVADAFDVMTSGRSHKKPLSAAAAREELARNAGGQFDADVVRAFLRIAPSRLRWVAGPASLLGQLPFLRSAGAGVGMASVAASAALALAGAGVIAPPDVEPEISLPPLPAEEVTIASTTTVPLIQLGDARRAEVEIGVLFEETTDIEVLDPSELAAGLAAEIWDAPTWGTATIRGGILSYTPGPGFDGEDRLAVLIMGPEGEPVALIELLLSSSSPNAPPGLVDDEAVIDEDVPVLVDVLANDLDDLGLDPATLVVIVGPEHGTTEVLPEGILFTPEPNWFGMAEIRYRVENVAGLGGVATVMIEVLPVNDPPMVGDDSAETDEDVPVVIPALSNDEDPEDELDPGTLFVAVPPTLGTAMPLDGALRYVPDPEVSGVETFFYGVCDLRGACAEGIVTVTVAPVNDPPFAEPDGGATIEGVAVTIDILTNDGDPEGDTLTPTPDSFSALGGTVSCEAGACLYTPPVFGPTQSGLILDTFGYVIDDGNGGTASAVVTIEVTVEEDPNNPPSAADDAATVAEDGGPVVITPLSNDSDPDGDLLTITSSTDPEKGTLTRTGTTFTYTPDAEDFGTQTFGYTISDGRGGTASATVTITITEVNDKPTAVADTATTESGEPVTVDVLANDSDIDGELDAATLSIKGQPGDGTAVPSDGKVTYTSDDGFEGTDTFVYKICDTGGKCASATVTVTVDPFVNPVKAVDDTATTTEDTAFTFVASTSWLGNDTHDDGETLTIKEFDTASKEGGTIVDNLDGSYTYTPAAEFSGEDTFTYTATDAAGNTGTATVTVTVTAVDDPPDAVDDTASTDEDTPKVFTASTDWLGNDTDPENDPLTITAFDAASTAGGTIVDNLDGTYTYTPAAGFNGSDTFTYTVSDGAGGTDTATVTVSVGAVNDPPEATDDSAATDEDTPKLFHAATDWLGNDTDPDADPLTVSAFDGISSAGGSVVDHGNGTYTYTPPAHFGGTDTFTYTVSDGTDSDTATVTVTVSAVNDAPNAAGDWYTTAEDTPLTFTAATDWLGNDTDIEGGAITLTGFDAITAAGGTVTDLGAGSYRYDPPADFAGADTFTYSVTDGTDPATGAVLIAVTPVADAPLAGDDPDGGDTAADFEVALVATLVIPAAELVDNDTDADGDALSIVPSGPTATAQGSVTCDANGCTYTPNGTFIGVDTFTYDVTDGALTDTATVTVTVTDYVLSPEAGRAVINEVLFEQSTGLEGIIENDEFVELYNASGHPLDVSGWMLSDSDHITGSFDAPASFTYAFPGGSVIPAGGYAVLWLGVDQTTTNPGFTNVVGGTDLELWAGGSTLLDSAGDELWLYDEGYELVDFVAWGPDTAANRNGNPPDALGVWDPLPNNEGALIPVAFGQSLSLAPNGQDADDSFCWEPATSGAATCAAAALTIDTDAFGTRVTSVGGANNATTNNPPVATSDGPFPVFEDGAIVFSDAGDWLANDTDADLDPVTLSGFDVATAQGGTVTDVGGGSYRYEPPADFSGTDTFTYSITDGLGGYATATVTVAVGALNDAPAFDRGFDVVIAEDSGAHAAAWATGMTAGPADEAGQALSFEVVANSNADLFATPPAVALDGTLSFTPAADAAGTAFIGIRLRDDGGTADGGEDTSPTVMLTIVVTPVNDVPRFTKGPDVTVTEGSGAYSAAWGTGIVAGPPDEAWQVLTFEVTANDNPGLFDVLPAVAGDGTLTFTPVAVGIGTATLEIRIRDDGGTADGGIDVSAVQIFTITVGG